MEKICQNCKKIFTKPKKYSYKQWDTKKFCSISCLGKHLQTGYIKKCIKCNKDFYYQNSMKVGKFCSNSCSAKNNTNNIGKTWKVKNTENFKGRKWTDEMKLKIKERIGEKHHKWIKDRTKLKKSDKKHLDVRYRDWMFSVKKRDNWKCKLLDCNCKGRLESHHIFDWENYPHLRYDINNGITLCAFHHPKGREKEKRMVNIFIELLSVSKEIN